MNVLKKKIYIAIFIDEIENYVIILYNFLNILIRQERIFLVIQNGGNNRKCILDSFRI